MQRSDLLGVLAAVLSSLIVGSAVAVTRSIAGRVDPLMLALMRYGIGAACLLPLALWLDGRRALPKGRDWLAMAGLGTLFCALFPLFFNASLARTTAAHGALALSTLPLLTMALSGAVGAERLGWTKLLGVAIAFGGVALALGAGIAGNGATWQGDLLMIGAAASGAIYNVASRVYLRRFPALAFTGFCLLAGTLVLLILGWIGGWLAVPGELGTGGWSAIAFLGIIGCALTFFLWVWALEHTTPTRVAISVTANPIVATFLGAAFLGEEVSWTLAAGLALVILGIGCAAWNRRGHT
ncbi:MAG: DMT family transporter [Proteobacteria bacterium]|nr:DMT family transporter [Pseudomonadota bacterium]